MTYVRYRVAGFAVAVAAITYLDRVCISILAPSIMHDLRLSRLQMSFVFSSFTLAYALFEVPTAWWADRVGAHKVMTRIVLWWSTFTVATASATSYSALLILRFLFGIGEAGCWPITGRVFARWIPAEQRGRVQGFFFAGAHLSGGLTPILVAFLATFLHWRTIFILFGCVGLVWAGAWRHWFRDEPRDHPSVNEEECRLIEQGRSDNETHSGSWKTVWRTRGLFPLCVQYFANTYGFYFFITWLPLYLAKARSMEKTQLAIFSGLPLIVSVAADIGGGVASDALSKRFGYRVGRSFVGASAYLLAAVLMLGGALATSGWNAGLLIALGGAASMFSLAPAWNTAVQLGGRNPAMLGALMNTAGQVGGILSPIVLAQVVDRFGSWSLPLHILSCLYFLAALAWLSIKPMQPQVEPASRV